MKKSRFAVALSVTGLVMASMMPLKAHAAVVNLPPAQCNPLIAGNNCLQFDDASVYSLGVLKYYQTQFGAYPGANFTYKPNEAAVTVIDGAGQGTAAQGTGKSIDDPFRAMNSTKVDNLRFLMAGDSITTGTGTIPSDPAGGPTGDNTKAINQVVTSNTFTQQEVFGTKPWMQFKDGETDKCYLDMKAAGCMQSWDADITSLLNTVAGANALMFMFNNNETGKSGDLAGQDLLAWARVTLFNTATNAMEFFTLSGNNTVLPQQSRVQTAGVDDILPTANDKWAYVHSEVCVHDTTGEVFLGECTASPFGANGDTVNQSLGADTAGFAITVAALNDILFNDLNPKFGKYSNIAVDIRFSHLNNGGDNVWIMGANIPCSSTDPNCNPVPEPGSLALAALGLLALAGIRRRRTTRPV